jgi:CBS domain-containing protein
MNVGELMVKNVTACYPQSTLDDAARIMWERDCGFVPVLESAGSAKVIGVITDRDACMAAYTRGASLKDLRVADAMAKVVWSCKPGDSLPQAESKFAAARVRRLPVVDDSDLLVGVLSLADVARAALPERNRAGTNVSEAEVGALVAAICRPRALAAPAAG